MKNGESSSFINKLPASNSTDGFYLIYSKWEDNTVKVNIIDFSIGENSEWTGEISMNTLREFANDLEIIFDDFVEECKRALTTNGGIEYFEYCIEENQFKWTKLDKFKITYGSIEILLTKDLAQKLFLESIDLIDELKRKLETVELNAQKEFIDNKHVIDSYKKCVAEKRDIEKTLLTKFTLLLNTKKEKIAELQKFLSETDMNLFNVSTKRVRENLIESCSNQQDIPKTQSVCSQSNVLPKRLKMMNNQPSKSRLKIEATLVTIPNPQHSDDQSTQDDQDLFDKM